METERLLIEPMSNAELEELKYEAFPEILPLTGSYKYRWFRGLITSKME
ncbi:MAG: hypothetical protein RR347_07795 [Anaerovoracaceae bacterium]